jgi:cereblon
MTAWLCCWREERRPAPGKAADALVRRALCCRHCGLEVSDTAALFTQDGAQVTRVFANPYGLLHEIVTVRRAQNLVPVGPATTEFSWFPGYAWEIALCAGCQAHLGWRFGGSDEPREFWGLLRRELTER